MYRWLKVGIKSEGMGRSLLLQMNIPNLYPKLLHPEMKNLLQNIFTSSYLCFIFTDNCGRATLRRGKSICRWTAWRLDSLGNELMIINFGWSTFTCLSFLPLSTLQIHSLHKIQFFTVPENQFTSSILSAYNCCPNAVECNLHVV